jgi:hypothetical protein
VKRLGREADHSPPSSAEVRECVELYLHSPNMPSWRGALLKKHRDNFTFYFRQWTISSIPGNAATSVRNFGIILNETEKKSY